VAGWRWAKPTAAVARPNTTTSRDLVMRRDMGIRFLRRVGRLG